MFFCRLCFLKMPVAPESHCSHCASRPTVVGRSSCCVCRKKVKRFRLHLRSHHVWWDCTVVYSPDQILRRHNLKSTREPKRISQKRLNPNSDFQCQLQYHNAWAAPWMNSWESQVEYVSSKQGSDVDRRPWVSQVAICNRLLQGTLLTGKPRVVNSSWQHL